MHMTGKSKGSILDFLSILLMILGMSIVVMAYLECTNLMMKKLEIGQISRKYILKMESDGYLKEPEKESLLQELKNAGMSGIDISGTTLQPVAYGEEVYLKIEGTVEGKVLKTSEEMWREGFEKGIFHVEEERMSTAKN